MPVIEFKLEGIENLEAKCQDAAVLAPIIHDLMAKSILTVERRAKQYSPVDTGRLRSSIHGRIDAKPVPLWGEVSTNVFYASFVEYGHRQQVGRYVSAIGKRLVRSFVPGKPYMAPALKDSEADINRYMTEADMKLMEEWNK